jgi:hypothetical protein
MTAEDIAVLMARTFRSSGKFGKKTRTATAGSQEDQETGLPKEAAEAV